jgi:hypothetical protein
LLFKVREKDSKFLKFTSGTESPKAKNSAGRAKRGRGGP